MGANYDDDDDDDDDDDVDDDEVSTKAKFVQMFPARRWNGSGPIGEGSGGGSIGQSDR